MATEQIQARPLANGQDFWTIYLFLLFERKHFITGQNWTTRRWEKAFLYKEEIGFDEAWAGRTMFWRDGENKVVAVAHPERGHYGATQIAPAYRSFEPCVLDWCVDNLAHEGKLALYASDQDEERQRLLAERGFGPTDEVCYHYEASMPLEHEQDEPKMVEGYTLRKMRFQNEQDAHRRTDLLNAVEGGSYHTVEKYMTFWHYTRTQSVGLELAAVAPDGSFAAYISPVLDDRNFIGMIPLIVTHPAHRGRGLARALIDEAIYRLTVHYHLYEVLAEARNPEERRFFEHVLPTPRRTVTGRYWLKRG